MNVWITGASSGIGEATALKYASMGACLILTSSRYETLSIVAENCRKAGAPAVVCLECDLGNPRMAAGIAEKAWSAFQGGIDILFCNAGVSQRTLIEDTSIETVRKIMEINYFSNVAITSAILPRMLANGGGHIAVTTSIAGKFGFPLRSAYCSSKSALYGWFETMRAEYSDKGISVTIVCPGRVSTNIAFNALDRNGERHGHNDPGQAGGISAEKAADKIVKAIGRGRSEVLIGGKELIMVYIKRFFPRLCARIAAGIRPV